MPTPGCIPSVSEGAAVGRGVAQLEVGSPQQGGELRQQQAQPGLTLAQRVGREPTAQHEGNLPGDEDQ